VNSDQAAQNREAFSIHGTIAEYRAILNPLSYKKPKVDNREARSPPAVTAGTHDLSRTAHYHQDRPDPSDHLPLRNPLLRNSLLCHELSHDQVLAQHRNSQDQQDLPGNGIRPEQAKVDTHTMMLDKAQDIIEQFKVSVYTIIYVKIS
jgi:hypothetical protein